MTAYVPPQPAHLRTHCRRLASQIPNARQTPGLHHRESRQRIDGRPTFSPAIRFKQGKPEPVVVTGAPHIGLSVGGRMVYANYISGSGSRSLLFRYIVQAGDDDSSGITLPGPIDANGGTLRDAVGNDLTLALNNIESTAAVLIDTISPGASALVRADPNPTSAAIVRFTLTFSDAVSGVDTSDLTIAASGTAAGSIASVNVVDALSYTILVNGISGTGTLGLNLNSSGTGIADMAGNPVSGGLAARRSRRAARTI